MNARKVHKARRIIARDACPARWGIRHRWESLRVRNTKVRNKGD